LRGVVKAETTVKEAKKRVRNIIIFFFWISDFSKNVVNVVSFSLDCDDTHLREILDRWRHKEILWKARRHFGRFEFPCDSTFCFSNILFVCSSHF